MSADDSLARPYQGWGERHRIAAEVFVPWLDGVHPLAGKTVLDYGCGWGAVTCAIGARAERVIGYDIEESFVAEARDRASALGVDGLELEAASAEHILDRVRRHTGEVDVFLLYAVLEHLTVAERLETLRAAREVVRDDGIIAVFETPNRLVDTDFHTSFLPFFTQLPHELALAYADRTPREGFRESIAAAREHDSDGGALTLARWGTGASYHEFELVFGDLGECVIAGGYDPALLDERKIHAEELAVARHLERERPDLPPPFSRFWLDLVLSPVPLDTAGVRLVRPWTAETMESPAARWTRWDTIVIDPGGPLVIDPGRDTDRAVCVLSCGASRVEVTARWDGGEARAAATGEPGTQLIADLALGEPVGRFTLETDASSHLHFVGCELERAGTLA